MNYYRFLDSRDIRNHLENMEYPLSTPEAAYLVWQCHNATLEEKFTAWEEIAKIMPDCPIPAGPGMADDVPASTNFSGTTWTWRKTAWKTSPREKTASLGRTFPSCPTRSGEKSLFGQIAAAYSRTIQTVSPIVGKSSLRKLAGCGFGSRLWAEATFTGIV